MFTQTAIDVEQLTRDLARRFSDMATYGGDRDRLSRAGLSRIDWLESKVEDGTFFSPVWSTAALAGKLYRIDGGHSSLMLAELIGSFPNGLMVAIRRFQCENEMDMAYLFDQFDHRRSLRSMSDKINAHRAIEKTVSDVSMTNLRHILSGLAYGMSGCGQERALDEDDRVKLMHEYAEFIVWANKFVGPKYMKRNGVIAAMYATRQKKPAVADAFWDEVLNASNPDNTSATRRLNSFLITAVVNKERAAVVWDARAFYAKCVHAWNAWQSGYSTDLKYHSNSPLPPIR